MKPKPARSPLKALPVLAFLITALVGWELAGNSAPAGKSVVSASSPASDASSRAKRRDRKTPGPGGEAGQRLAAIRASRDPAARLKASIDLATTLPISDFAAWMDGGWFDVRGGAELTVFSKIFEERWKSEDPEGFVAWATKNRPELANDMLASWATTQPQSVIDFYKNHPNDTAEVRSLAIVAKNAPALALQRFLEISANGSRDIRAYTGSLFTVLAEKSPAALEAALTSLSGELKAQAEAVLIAQRMKGAPDDEFAKLLERPDGFNFLERILSNMSSGNDRQPLQDKLLANLADLSSAWRQAIISNSYRAVGSKNAEAWINADLEGAGFTAEQAKNLRSSLVQQLYNQPETALKLLPDVEMDENSRHNLLENIFSNLRDKPDKVQALLPLLTTEEDRQFALAQIAPRQAGDGPSKIDNPTDWLTGLATVDPKNSGSAYSYISAARDWDPSKLAVLSQQFNALPDDTKRSVAQNLVRNGYSNRSPLEADAIRFLISNAAPSDPAPQGNDPFEVPTPSTQDPDIANIQLASRYIGKLARTDPTAASDWIQTLPEGPPKLWAQKNLNSLWSQYDPQAAGQWMKSLPAATQSKVKALGQK